MEVVKLETRVRVITVDPGLGGTGWCYWSALKHPLEEETFMLPQCWGVIKSLSNGSWMTRSNEISNQFANVVKRFTPYETVIEMPELWTTGKSMASAVQGDLFKLSYLIGQISKVISTIPVLISPRDWKGQLPKDAVIKRIKKRCPNICDAIENHEADAIGMGLSLQGVL